MTQICYVIIKNVLAFSKQSKRHSLNRNKDLGSVLRNRSITMFVQHERLFMCTPNLQYKTDVQAWRVNSNYAVAWPMI